MSTSLLIQNATLIDGTGSDPISDGAVVDGTLQLSQTELVAAASGA